MPETTLLTTDEVLDYLRVNLRTLYRLLKSGRIPAVRVGRQWRFRREDVDQWLEQRQQTVQPDEQGEALSAPSMAAEGVQPRILLVDDQENVRQLLTSVLSRMGYEVIAVGDGESALAELRGHPYDLLITDLNLPGITGIDLIREARHAREKLAIIIITGYASEQTAIDAANLGVTGYLTKPFLPADLRAAVERTLGSPGRGLSLRPAG